MNLLEKISNLIVLFGSALIATLAFGFTACSEDDDDPNDMISGSNNNYSISYTNSSADTSRGYKTTTFKHAGSLVQITMNSDSTKGAMGYIWDLESNSSRAVAAPRVFCIAGFNYNYTAEGKVAYYVSRYKNVVDIEASNFGTDSPITYNGTAYTAEENAKIALSTKNSFTPTKDSSGNVVVTIDVYEDGVWSWNDAKTERKYTSYNGGYVVEIYDGAVTLSEIANGTATAVDSTSFTASELGYTVSDSSKSVVSQFNGAVYANVYANSTLNGSWKYLETYKSADVVEE